MLNFNGGNSADDLMSLNVCHVTPITMTMVMTTVMTMTMTTTTISELDEKDVV